MYIPPHFVKFPQAAAPFYLQLFSSNNSSNMYILVYYTLQKSISKEGGGDRCASHLYAPAPILYLPVPAFILARCCSCQFLPTAHMHSWSSDPWATHIHSGVPLPTFIVACHCSHPFIICACSLFVPVNKIWRNQAETFQISDPKNKILYRGGGLPKF